jgi:hypothetical protein
MSSLRRLGGPILLCLCACSASEPAVSQSGSPAETGPDAGEGEPEPEPGDGDGDGDDGAGPDDGDDGESCVGVKARAELTRAPVDIIWVVDNSKSMQPAIDEVTRGINALARRIGDSDLDYRVIMLSLRGKGERQVGNDTRYAVCVPEPLAADAQCSNGERFFHASVDMRSTQPLEQLLGTLGQTDGYRAGESRGGEPWRQQLRSGATKSIVVVTDDDSRLSASAFEHFAGGANPNNGNNALPPGLLDASWQGLFDDYLFHGLYGWGSATDPSVACRYADDSEPAASGETYSELVRRTGGVRAQICDGSAAWSPFFDAIATAVETHTPVACNFAIPAAPAGMELDPGAVNVTIQLPGSAPVKLGKVAPDACGTEGGWHYDDEQAPREVVLCPESCELARQGTGAADGGVDVEFGCATIVL